MKCLQLVSNSGGVGLKNLYITLEDVLLNCPGK